MASNHAAWPRPQNRPSSNEPIPRQRLRCPRNSRLQSSISPPQIASRRTSNRTDFPADGTGSGHDEMPQPDATLAHKKKNANGGTVELCTTYDRKRQRRNLEHRAKLVSFAAHPSKSHHDGSTPLASPKPKPNSPFASTTPQARCPFPLRDLTRLNHYADPRSRLLHRMLYSTVLLHGIQY